MQLRRRSLYGRLVAWTTILSLVFAVTWPGGAALGYTEKSRTGTREPVAEGVAVETIKMQTTEGPLNIYVMTVDLTNPYVKVGSLVGTNGVITRNQSVTNLAREAGAIAAINGDFFQMDEKAPLGITVQSGELVTSPAQRTDMYGFGLTKDSVPVFALFSFQGTVTSPGGLQHPLFGINKPTYLIATGVSSDVNRLNMYTPRWGSQSRGKLPGLTGVVEMVVENDVVKELRVDQPGTAIPANGYVLAGHGEAGQFLTTNFKVGDPVQVSYAVSPEGGNLLTAIGGQALLVQNGQRHWFSQNITGNRARTAIGASQDGKTLYLVVVDGGSTSRGMTQEELADFMISIGAWTAVNLDGGGSSTMVARQLGDQNVSLLNTPLYTSQRSVPNGLGIFSTAPAGAFAGLKVTGPQILLVGMQKAFAAKGYDEHFNPYTVQQGDITWTISPDLGYFEGNVLTATRSGDARVKASYNGVTQEYPVKILGSADIAKVEVTPDRIAVSPGDSVNISVRITTKRGEVFTLQPGEYEVQLKGDVGTISGGRFTAADRMAVGELVVKIDSTTATVKISVGQAEKPFYGFETAKIIKFRSYPADQIPGSARLTGAGEPTFRGVGAARLEYDFTVTAKTRAAYANFEGGLTLPEQPLGLGLWVMGDGGNGHWLRARITDADGTEKLLDFARNVNWKGWKYVKADIPAGVKFPIKLTDIYLVETEGGPQDKGVIYFDEISLITPPAEADLGTKQPEALSAEKQIPAGIPVLMELGPELDLLFQNPAGSATYTVSARQLPGTELPTPGYYPVLPLYKITAKADGNDVDRLPGQVKIQLKVRGISVLSRARLMLWDEKTSSWQQIPGLVDPASGIITAKTARTGILVLMEDVRPVPVFSDLDSSWAKDLIGEMAARRIVNGYPDGRFLPTKGVTRAEFVTLLANTLGWAPETASVQFKDKIPDWAGGAIAAAVNRGVVKGYDDGTFQPHKIITRAEMAVIIDKALDLADSDQPSNYQDWRQIPSWAVQSIRNTKVAGIMQGSNNRFRPRDIANRAEATAVVGKVLEYYIKS